MPQAGQSGQAGEVEAFFTSLTLTTNVVDGNVWCTKCKKWNQQVHGLARILLAAILERVSILRQDVFFYPSDT